MFRDRLEELGVTPEQLTDAEKIAILQQNRSEDFSISSSPPLSRTCSSKGCVDFDGKKKMLSYVFKYRKYLINSNTCLELLLKKENFFFEARPSTDKKGILPVELKITKRNDFHFTENSIDKLT